MSLKTNIHSSGASLLGSLWKIISGEPEEAVSQPHASAKVGSLQGKSGNKDRFEMATARVDSPFQRASRPLTSLDPQRLAVLDQLIGKGPLKKA